MYSNILRRITRACTAILNAYSVVHLLRKKNNLLPCEIKEIAKGKMKQTAELVDHALSGEGFKMILKHVDMY